jgi:hypothetical protein
LQSAYCRAAKATSLVIDVEAKDNMSMNAQVRETTIRMIAQSRMFTTRNKPRGEINNTPATSAETNHEHKQLECIFLHDTGRINEHHIAMQ